MKHKIIALWYDDEFNSDDYMHTGLSFELENGKIIKHYTTDTVKPFNDAKN